MANSIKLRLESFIGSFFEYLGLGLPLIAGVFHLMAAYVQYNLYLNNNTDFISRAEGVCTNVHGNKTPLTDYICYSHWIDYRFSVNSIEYSGTDFIEENNSDWDLKKKINMPVIIYYFPEDPNRNTTLKRISHENKLSFSFYWCSIVGIIFSIAGLLPIFYFKKTD